MIERGNYLLSIVSLFLLLWLIGYQMHREIYREDLELNYIQQGVLSFHHYQTDLVRMQDSESVSQVMQRKGDALEQFQPFIHERYQFSVDLSNMLSSIQHGRKPKYLQLISMLNRQQKMLENSHLKQDEAQANIRLLQAYLPEYQYELKRASAKLKARYTGI